MLDVGEDRGALVVYTSEARFGEEIEIRPHDGEWSGLHTAVRARNMGDIVRYAGVFGSLPAGLYDLRIRHNHHTRPHHARPHHIRGGDDVHQARVAHVPAVRTVKVQPGAVIETNL